MPRREIELIVGEFYHLYNKAVSNTLLFREMRNYPYFINKIKEYLIDCSNIIAYCLMPSHYHILVELKSDGLPLAMSKMAMSYAKSYNKVYQRVGSLFQGRYQIHHIQDTDYLHQVVNYIHTNPVKAGIIGDPADWYHSSYREFIGIRKVDFINPKPILEKYKEETGSSIFEMMDNYRKEMERFHKAPGA